MTQVDREHRREALGQDALLFCLAFTGGALVYLLARAIVDPADFWEIGLSDGLLLSGLVVGEAFLLWNNGLRQGLRGHSIGKHRLGLVVVDRKSGQPTGAVRGLVRGGIMALLLDLCVAAIPIGLPTVLREFTPESWHIGAFAYLALAVIVLPVITPSDHSIVDRLTGTEVVAAHGKDAVTRPARRRALVALDVAGVVGVFAVACLYLSFYWPLLWRLPELL